MIMDYMFPFMLILFPALFFIIKIVSFLKPWSSALLNIWFFLTVFIGISNIPFQCLKSHELFQIILSILIGLAAGSLLLILKRKSEA